MRNRARPRLLVTARRPARRTTAPRTTARFEPARTTTLILTALLAALSRPALADFSGTFSSGFANGGVIPDGSFIGLSDTRTLTGVTGNTITDVNVRLNISGGWNGDLYAYLVHSGGFSVLLNRVGRATGSSFGYSDAGMNVTLDDQNAQTFERPGHVGQQPDRLAADAGRQPADAGFRNVTGTAEHARRKSRFFLLLVRLRDETISQSLA